MWKKTMQMLQRHDIWKKILESYLCAPNTDTHTFKDTSYKYLRDKITKLRQ